MENQIENPQAFPHDTRDPYSGSINGQEMGMTLRDYFAAKENGYNLSEGMTIKSAEEIMGREIPKETILNRMYWYELEAKLQYMKADAMLKERTK